MNFKNETGYAKRQTYRQSSQTNRQSTVQLEQQKTDQATSQISNQNKSVQPSNATNVSSQEYTESQTANFDSIQQQFSTRTVQPQTSKYLYIFINIYLYTEYPKNVERSVNWRFLM